MFLSIEDNHTVDIRSVINKFPEWLLNDLVIELYLIYDQIVDSAHPDEKEGLLDHLRLSRVMVEALKCRCVLYQLQFTCLAKMHDYEEQRNSNKSFGTTNFHRNQEKC